MEKWKLIDVLLDYFHVAVRKLKRNRLICHGVMMLRSVMKAKFVSTLFALSAPNYHYYEPIDSSIARHDDDDRMIVRCIGITGYD